MRSNENDLLIIYLIIDLIILNVSIFLVAYLGGIFFNKLNISPDVYLLHGNLAWIITYFLFSKRNLFLRDGFSNRIWRITRRTIIFLLVASIVAFVTEPGKFSRFFILTYTVVFYLMKLLFYRFLYTYLKSIRSKGKNIVRTAIIDYNGNGKTLRAIMDNNPMLGYSFDGYIGDLYENSREEQLGRIEELEYILKNNNIQALFVSLSMFTNNVRVNDLLRICNQVGVRLFYVPDNQSWFAKKRNSQYFGSFVVLKAQEIPLDNIGARFIKRTFDIVFSLLVIILLLSWVVPLVAIIQLFDSPGPVFFRQKRTGANNQAFKCVKFRSMKVNGDSDQVQSFAGDKRITRFGNFMRKTNIDELPQFFNVLTGKMSVVGPRPHMLKHTEEYSQLIDYYMARHYVKPGITGWAQVAGWRGNTDEIWKMEKRVQYDTEYTENWSMLWDLKIIWLTIFGKNAYKNAG